jgi:HEAT repeat protein
MRSGCRFIALSFVYMQMVGVPALHCQTDSDSRRQTAKIPPPSNNAAMESYVPLASSLQKTRDEAWQTLEGGCRSDKIAERASAIRVLGLLRNQGRARTLAEKALSDSKSEVRSAAAAALGDMEARTSIPQLRKVLDDDDPAVALAAAHALYLMHDKSSYQVYYEVLTRQRKSGKGLISSQMSVFSDRKKMAQLGFEEGIGFVPFGGIGWKAFKELTKDDSSPVRAASARVLADDPDPTTTKVLAEQAGDKSWIVRAAALEALAKRGDPSALDTVKSYIFDEKDVVQYTAAAATLRLLGVRSAKALGKQRRIERTSAPTIAAR